jgi:hypothetical protein
MDFWMIGEKRREVVEMVFKVFRAWGFRGVVFQHGGHGVG